MTNSRDGNPLFALKGQGGGGIGAISSLTVSSLLVESSEIGLGNNAYISTIGGQLVYFDGTTLEPISQLSSLSTIEDWSFYPAISTVNMGNENLLGANIIAGNSISTNAGFISTLFTQEQQGGTGFISSLSATTLNATSTVTNNAVVNETLTASTIVANDISTFTLTAISTIHAISSISSAQLNVEAINTSSINGLSFSSIVSGGPDPVFSTVTAANYISTPDIECSTINGATFGTSSITVDVVGVSTLAANSISTLGAVMRDALVSTLQFNPSLGGVSLGGVNLGLGSILGNVVGWGAGVMGAATGTVGMITGTAALMMGRPGNNINSSNFEMINGTSQIQFSTLGTSTVSIFREVQSTGDPSQVPGEEVFISTIIPPGAHCIRTVSDPINTMSSPSSTVQAFGEWEEIPYILPSSISTVADWAEFPAISSIQFGPGVNGVIINPAVGGLIDLRSDNGLNVRDQTGSGFTDMVAKGITATGTLNTTSTLVLGNNAMYLDAQALASTVSVYKYPPGSGLGQVLASAMLLDAGGGSQTALFYNNTNNHVQALQGSIGGAISTIAYQSDFSQTLSTSTVDANQGNFNFTSTGVATTALEVASTISTAQILGSATDMFGIPGYNGGLNIQASTIALTSTPLIVHTGNYNGSTCSFFQANIRDVVASTVTASTVNAGFIPAVNTSSISLTGTAGYGLSSILFVSTAALPGFGTSTCAVFNTDLNIGQNDLYAQQIRLGYLNPSSQPSEIIFHSPNNTQRAFNMGNNDITVRMLSTTNGTGGGYLLDTAINPPFFSTLGGTSTAMMAFFPSTAASTIGVSTISIVPDKTYVGSWYSSTSQTVAGANTVTGITHDAQTVNIGGFSYAGSTITLPVAGTYEIIGSIQFDTTSGGTNEADFWLMKNGTDLVNSASKVSIVNNGETIGTVSLIDTFVANDQVGWRFASADANMTATFFNSTVTTPYTRPGVPSIITNIKRLG
jgi:hypothetical protein